MTTRRDFLRTAAVAPVALGLAGVNRAADPVKPYGGFTVGIQSYTFRNFTLEQTLKRIKDLGLTTAEFYRGHIPTDSKPDQLKRIKALCAEYGVAPLAFGVEAFSKDHAANQRIFAFTADLGAKYLTADPSPDSFDSLDKLVAEHKIAIAIHPHGPTGRGKQLHRWSSAEVILKAVKDHNPLIGTCLDTGHLIRTAQVAEPLDPIQQIGVMGARNFGLHLKDHDNKRKTDVPFGDPTGVLNVPGVLAALKKVKFAGYVSIEYEANADNPLPDVEKCLAYLRTAAAKVG